MIEIAIDGYFTHLMWHSKFNKLAVSDDSDMVEMWEVVVEQELMLCCVSIIVPLLEGGLL